MPHFSHLRPIPTIEWAVFTSDPDIDPFDILGPIPDWISPADPRPAREQIDEHYAHGGGWRPDNTSHWTYDPTSGTLTFTGDPPMEAIAACQLRNEVISLYPHAWLAINRTDLEPGAPGWLEVCRVD